MLLNLTDFSDEPLQSQITNQIRAKILSGELNAEETLPSIRALARNEKVSVITVQRGYEALEREGLIHSRRGKGFFVSNLKDNAKKKMAEDRLLENLEPIITAALNEGLEKHEIIKKVELILSNGKK